MTEVITGPEPVRRAARHLAPRRGGRSPHPMAIGLALGTFAAYAVLAVLRHRALHTTLFDLGIFEQGQQGYAALRAPVSALKGMNLLADHFSPALVLLAPAYALFPRPETLLVAQAALIGASVLPVWALARRRLDPTTATVVAVAYAVSFGLQAAVAFDFHEVALAVPLVAWTIERAESGAWRSATVLAVATGFVKEDLWLFLVGFGLYAAARGLPRLGIAVAAVGIAAFELVTNLVMPAFAPGSQYAYWSSQALGGGLGDVLLGAVRQPVRALRLFLEPFEVKGRTLAWVLAPSGFLALASPVLLLAVTLVAERFLSGNPLWWGTGFHYDALLMPVGFLAAVDTMGRVSRSRPPGAASLVLAWRLVLAVGALAAVALVPGGLATLGQRSLYDPPRLAAARAVLAAVPDGTVVEADNHLGPHLVARAEVHVLGRTDRQAEWVVVDTRRASWPFDGLRDKLAYASSLPPAGYARFDCADGYAVFHRGPAATAAGRLAAVGCAPSPAAPG